eukprot:gene2776-biopygen11664
MSQSQIQLNQCLWSTLLLANMNHPDIDRQWGEKDRGTHFNLNSVLPGEAEGSEPRVTHPQPAATTFRSMKIE